MELLPIGQRVTHFGGGPNTHGKGTIVAYNGVKPNTYVQTNMKDAVALVGQVADPEVKIAMLGGIANGFYDGARCPYVVQWDPRTDDSDIAKKYPEGYKDVYEHDSVRAIQE